FHGADSRDQQNRDFRTLYVSGNGFDPFQIGVRAESIVEARPGETVAVSDFDRIHTRGIEGFRDCDGLIDGIPMPDRVHAIAKCHVLNVKAGLSHAVTPVGTLDWFSLIAATRSPVRSAADVMMSRLPAYFGR